MSEELEALKNRILTPGRWFGGLFNIVNYAKAILFAACLVILCLFGYGIYCLGVNIHDRFVKPKKIAPAFSTTGISGGQVHNSQDEKTVKAGLINF